MEFIREQYSWQKHEPLLGKLIDCAYAEPFHNSNNAWQYLHRIMLEIALEKSKLPPGYTNLDNLPNNSPILVYLRTLKDTVELTRLVKKLTRWFRDGRKGVFSHWFTGKETKVFCHKFMFVIHCLNQEHADSCPRLRLSALAFCWLQLRDAISYFSQVEISEQEVKNCQQAYQFFYNICALLLKEVTPTVWTIGYAIRRHIKILFDKFGMGLGINSICKVMRQSMLGWPNLQNTPKNLLGGQWCYATIRLPMFGSANMIQVRVCTQIIKSVIYWSM